MSAPVVKFALAGGAALRARLKAMGEDAPRAVGAALYQEAELIMTASKRRVPVDEGELRASGHVQLPRLTRFGASVTMGYGGAGAPYAVYIHEGTGPAVGRPQFMPPPSAIEGWVRRNLRPASDDEARRLAFIVARAISRRGLAPTKFLSAPLNEAAAGMDVRLARRLDMWIMGRGST